MSAPGIQQGLLEEGTRQGLLEEGVQQGYRSTSDSGDDATEAQALKFCEPSQGKPTNPCNLKYSEDTDIGPQIQAAIKEINKLDTILENQQFKEEAIKNQGKAMRAVLWNELQSVRTTGSHQNVENMNLFLRLFSSWLDTADPSCAKEDEICTSVFHTEINLEDWAQQSQDVPGELETNECINPHSKRKNNKDFIKKNIELAKDSRNRFILLEGERKRLHELLKNIEGGIELQGLKENVSGWLAPGEGYTPKPMEFHLLNEIEIKLQKLPLDGDFSTISSSCSKSPSQIYQESLIYANRRLEVVPGEPVLRDIKEKRNQQNHLKEINHLLESLRRNY
ncbi:PREDICTED: fibrous sheath-interacting protein 1, partial [Acanthisitta chloris]|uniref:fibrous sheath-interacting protein 1 n=1 Tax=Acanthisitta chloris TaxID=57068 RepID=UPI0004F0EC59